MQQLSVLLQESDDDFRKEIAAGLSLDNGFLLRKSYKSFHLLSVDFFSHLPDVIIFNWQYPQDIMFDFIERALVVHPQLKVVVTFDFVQPDFLVDIERMSVSCFLIKPFVTSDLMKPALFFSRHPFLKYHAERLR